MDVIFISEEIEKLKEQLSNKELKLQNQAKELDHLTNNLIPELKKQNKNLKAVKVELTDALEKSTRKYFNQLEINADLSESVTKKGVALQLSKVRIEEIEKLVAQIEEESASELRAAEAKLKKLEERFEDSKGISPDILKDNESLKNKINDLENKLKSKDKELSNKNKEIKNIAKDHEDSDNIIKRLQTEIDSLNASIKEKDEIIATGDGLRGQIAKLEAELKDAEDKLDNKIREYDKLSTSVKSKEKTISSLKAKNEELIAAAKEPSKSSGGFFNKLFK